MIIVSKYAENSSDEITVTFVRDRKTEKLFKQMSD